MVIIGVFMNNREYQFLQGLQAAKIAFYMSPYAKHGDEGHAVFLSKWVPEYIKRISGEHKKQVKKYFKGCKTPSSFLKAMELIYDKYTKVEESLAKVKGLSDVEKLMEALSDSCVKNNIDLKWDYSNRAFEVLVNNRRHDECSVIVSTHIAQLPGGNMSNGVGYPIATISPRVAIESTLIEPLKMVGFEIVKINRHKGFNTIVIKTETNNNLAMQCDKKSA